MENASNAVVTTDNATVVTLAIATNPAGGTLSCTGGLTEVAVNGYAHFSGCSINIASASYYTLGATSSPVWTAATSNAFYIGANHLVFSPSRAAESRGAILPSRPSRSRSWRMPPMRSSSLTTRRSSRSRSRPTRRVGRCPAPAACAVAVNGYAHFSGCSINIASASYYTARAPRAARSGPLPRSSCVRYHRRAEPSRLHHPARRRSAQASSGRPSRWSRWRTPAMRSSRTGQLDGRHPCDRDQPGGRDVVVHRRADRRRSGWLRRLHRLLDQHRLGSYYTLGATSSPAWTAATSSAFLVGASHPPRSA